MSKCFLNLCMHTRGWTTEAGYAVMHGKASWLLRNSGQQIQLDSWEHLLFLHSPVYYRSLDHWPLSFSLCITSHFSHSFYFICMSILFFLSFSFTSYQVIFHIINGWNNYSYIAPRFSAPDTFAFFRDCKY